MAISLRKLFRLGSKKEPDECGGQRTSGAELTRRAGSFELSGRPHCGYRPLSPQRCSKDSPMMTTAEPARWKKSCPNGRNEVSGSTD